MNANAQSTAPALSAKIRGYWRLKAIFFSLTGICALLTMLVAIIWPPIYRTGSTILIEQQEIPQELVRSAVSSFADQRVQVISQRVMTTQNLLSLVERFNFDPGS